MPDNSTGKNPYPPEYIQQYEQLRSYTNQLETANAAWNDYHQRGMQQQQQQYQRYTSGTGSNLGTMGGSTIGSYPLFENERDIEELSPEVLHFIAVREKLEQSRVALKGQKMLGTWKARYRGIYLKELIEAGARTLLKEMED